ncbi:putative AAA ATPase [Skeletonema marinoi]|uniref:AAA ATPase n=1 Tax=Skeletonema marinoi TaxID=267567 RepID=A0AAD9DEG3_9STRA|nr:putative AAA ATPase [Skeletonema marinoi]
MPSNSNSEETIILLSDWIRRALVGVDLSALAGERYVSSTAYGTESSQWTATIRKSMALCSDDYLMPALQVAYSLANQICKEEETGKSPPLSVDWVDNIVVYINNQVGRVSMCDSDRCDSLDSLAFLDSLGFDPSDAGKDNFADNLFESIIHDHDGTTVSEEERDQGIEEDRGYIKAEFAPFMFNTNDDDNGPGRDAMQRIYSLGLVFYVIFSGGERPTAHFHTASKVVEQKLSRSSKSDTETEELSQDLSEDSDLLPFAFDQPSPIDLTGELSIFDSVGDDEYVHDPLGEYAFDGAPQHPYPKRRHSYQQNRNISNSCSVPMESLREKGLPSPLCDLVANMLECTNATLSGKDSYQRMSDVRSDLRLMLDNPNTFLRDLDMTKLSTTGSQFMEKTMFGRNVELSSIKDAYRQSMSGECGLATISGSSGTGKSLLANEFGKFVLADGGIFLSGKFDQLQQGKPFGALASTLDQYCGILLHNEAMASTKDKVVFQLRSVLGKESYHLTKIIPNLATILGSELPVLNHSEDCINAQKRVQYLLCQFVDVISTSSSAPITLFLDDLQWADAASIAAVNQLLFTAGPLSRKNFFFLGCARGKDSATKWSPCVDILVAGGIHVKLDCMDEHTLNTMVSETLCLSPRLTRTLSNVIYHKTKGNPLFVCRLMRSLNKEGLLRLSLSRRRWEWDTKKIRSRTLPDDVAIFLTDSLGELPDKVQWALFILSCFGASSESAFVGSKGLDRNILKNLEIAVAEGLVDKIDDQYRFAHDRIQEAAYNTIPGHRRCIIHFKYGLELSSLLIGDEEDAIASVLFTAVNQLNLGGPPAVQDESHNVTAARLNLRAGKKAMEMSDYETAYSYFDSGISFLRKKHWQEHYALSVELFSLAAKCALTIGDHTSLKFLIAEVVAKAHFFEDKLDVLFFETCALAYSYKLAESLEKGLDILSKLGIEVQGASVEARVQETKDLLSAHTDDEILNTKQMTDATMIIAMKFLGKLEIGMTQIMPKSVPYGNINEGYHYVKLALSLLDKVGSRENAGEVIFVCTQVKSYVEPLQAALEYHREGYSAAMASGGSSQAVINLLALNISSFFAGANLQRIQGMCDDTTQSAEKQQLIFMVHAQQIKRTVSKLIGTGEEPMYSSEGRDILASNSSVLRSYHYHAAYVSFIFRSYDDTIENIEKYFAFQENTWGILFLAHAVHAFHTGLISFWAARKSKEQRWYQRGNQSKLALRRWAESSQWTFENKWYLLEAEESFCNNDVEAAKTYYEKAITSAKLHKFVHEEALAHELAAYFYLELGEREQTVEHFMLAHEKHLEWGALGKCDSLLKFVEFMKKLWDEGRTS